MNKFKQTIKIAVSSGKGGVGKSMLASSLAILFSRKNKDLVAIDCDVDAPNLAVWLNETGDWEKSIPQETSDKALVDKDKCIGCGICEDKCVFEAIKMKDNKAIVTPFLCEGCGRCEIACPEQAIKISPVKNGYINIKNTKYGFPLVSGQLLPGESGSGKIIDDVKKEALRGQSKLAVIDTSPGTGCPVNAALRDVDFAVLVTEPTPSGWHDLQRVFQVVEHFRLNYGVVINKWDMNEQITRDIIKWAGREHFLGRISYDQAIMNSVANFVPIVESSLPAKQEIGEIFKGLLLKI